MAIQDNYNIIVNEGKDGRLHIDLTSKNDTNTDLHCKVRTHWWITGKILSWFGKAIEVEYLKDGKSQTKYINVGSLFKHVYCPVDLSPKEFESFYKKIREAIKKNHTTTPWSIEKHLNKLSEFLEKETDINQKINQIWKKSLVPFTLPPQSLLEETVIAEDKEEGVEDEKEGHVDGGGDQDEGLDSDPSSEKDDQGENPFLIDDKEKTTGVKQSLEPVLLLPENSTASTTTTSVSTTTSSLSETVVTISEPSAEHMRSVWQKLAKSSAKNPCHFGKYAIWKIESTAFKVVNIQVYNNWFKGEQTEKLGYGLAFDCSIQSQRVDNMEPPSFPADREHLIQALIAYATADSPAPSSIAPSKSEPVEDNFKEDKLESLYSIDYLKFFSAEDLKEIQKIRKPLSNMLQTYFQLDSYGYIVKPKQGQSLEDIEKEFMKNEKALAQAFYAVSKGGDAAYAEDIRTTLAGMNIASAPVNKSDSQIEGTPQANNIRPVSFVHSKSKAKGQKDPAGYKTKKTKFPAYIDRWGNAIWKGNRDYRHSLGSILSSYKNHDKVIRTSQMIDYYNRINRVRTLHQKGLLLGRVAQTAEVLDFIGHRYQMGNDILSTTLWPKERAPLIMKLFSEGMDTFGLLLDPSRVGDEDFGVSFRENAVTVGQGFQNHKARRKKNVGADNGILGISGADSIHAQRALLEALSSEVSEGGAVSNFQISLSDDGSYYRLVKKDSRSGGVVTKKTRTIFWNEQTYNRGIERDLFTGLFVKSDSDSFSKELKALFELQDRIRRKKGIYIPIFQFKGLTNELEEIVPDRLLLNVTGTKEVTPIQGHTSRFSQELQKVGITEEMALQMSQAMSEEETIKSLFELQLLMFNMKDITGKMTITVLCDNGADGFTYDSVRILDNLHLVFPTIHKTKNEEAQQPQLFFNDDDFQTIQKTPALIDYLKLTLSYNLKRFLGLNVKEGTVEFDPKIVDLFTQSDDPKKLDFAKVLSRALQAAVLFQIYGDDTNKTVIAIIQEVRKVWRLMGITPGGIDMILGSEEMQIILKKRGFAETELSMKCEPAKSGSKKEIPSCPYAIDDIDPFNITSLPKALKIHGFLAQLGINNDGSVNDEVFKDYQDMDPHLIDYEKTFIQTIQMLYVIKEQVLAEKIMKNIREKCPEFGFTVAGQDVSSPKSDLLMQWLQETLEGRSHQTEFPFARSVKEKASKKAAASVSRGGRYGSDEEEEDEEYGVRGGRFSTASSGRRGRVIAKEETVSKQIGLDAEGLQQQVEKRVLIPKFSPAQLKIGKELGLIDSSGTPLWTIKPSFHGGDEGKPTTPYIAVKDLLGHYASHLMTGPAFEPGVLAKDKDSFQLAVNPAIVSKDKVERLVTHTLAVTTEGDKQVLRPNGLQFSHSVKVPSYGKIDYNGGNEKHRFRSNDLREFHNSGHMGAYSDAALREVEKLDRELLSDQERRMKRAGLLPSSYVTVTAQGGFGFERKPLDRAYRVLYIGTAGAQFEKYNRGAFKYQKQTTSEGEMEVIEVSDENELEASDFIIKKGAAAETKPLFPQYYSQGKIPAYQDILPGQSSKLGDGDFTKPYVELLDGALFNREAFQKSSEDYMLELVLPHISERTSHQAYYLKAVLLGGGFFAQTDHAGNLRSEVINATLKTYIKAIQNKQFPVGTVIEFPRYGEQSAMPAGLMDQLKQAAAENGVEIVWTPEGDICDFKQQMSLSGKTIDISAFEKEGRLVMLGAADPMSWYGNEPSSASVEACFANNSNLRLMNWWANPKVLEVVQQIATS